jgi:hypothetical protein
MEPIARDELFTRLRRQFGRFQFYAEAEILYRGRKGWGRVTDISRNGMFVELADPPPAGTACTVRIALNQPLVLVGIVRRVVEDHGIGLSISAGEESIGRFCALLTALASEVPDSPVHAGIGNNRSKAPAVRKRIVPQQDRGTKQRSSGLAAR